jgi:LacI family transcriptional regulator
MLANFAEPVINLRIFPLLRSIFHEVVQYLLHDCTAWIWSVRGNFMQETRLRPRTAAELLAVLDAAHGSLGSGGRRLASFFADNLGACAMLTTAEVAQRCGVNASTVVRLTQSLGFAGYREFQAVLRDHVSLSIGQARPSGAAVSTLSKAARPLRLHLLSDSGKSFNEAAEAAGRNYCTLNPSVDIRPELNVSYKVEPIEFAGRIEALAAESDGIILVARDRPAINDAVRQATAKGIPVICLTTDLPSSGRTAYVGSDQYASGATAGWLCGRMLPPAAAGRVLYIYSVPFRCHQDREQGFRHVLRTEFPGLTIDEKVSSDESIDVIYEAVRRSIGKNGPPAAIYNVSGANLGVGRALEDERIGNTTLFIGHELNANSRSLLERGIMDVTIGHDFDREIALAVECIEMARRGVQPINRVTQSLVFTRFNCAIF